MLTAAQRIQRRHTEHARLLLVTPDEQLVRAAMALEEQGYGFQSLPDRHELLERIDSDAVDVVFVDVRGGVDEGLRAIESVHRHDPRIVVIAVGPEGALDIALRVGRAGGTDYVSRAADPESLAQVLKRHLGMRGASVRGNSNGGAILPFGEVVAQSPSMREVVSVARRIADTRSSVVITGPSGVGKEVMARAIHGESARRNRPFVAINCAAIPETLLESELFGHRRGAFTGAVSDKPGLFRVASGGTLFLDEVGDLPHGLQAKLLRVLQEREVRPVGGAESEPIDVRLLAATHRDLQAAVADGTLRLDLYYRIAVIELAIPRLAERGEDLTMLATTFLQTINESHGRRVREFSGAAWKVLLRHDWPGNARELRNAIERAVLMCDGDAILPEHLPIDSRRTHDEDFLDRALERSWTVDELQTAYARRVLSQNHGNKKLSARQLGVDRRTLQRWLGGR